MNRTESFVFRLTKQERQMIKTLAVKLQRSQSDAVRYVVLAAARELSTPSPEIAPDFDLSPQSLKQVIR